jgi:hypothetical protein
MKEKKEKLSKITFRGEKIEFSKAKTLLNKLKEGTIVLDLTEEERENYNSIKDILKGLTEKNYHAFILSIPIATKEYFDKVEACEKKSHPGERILLYSVDGAFCRCDECGEPYTRPLTEKEARDLNEAWTSPYGSKVA